MNTKGKIQAKKLNLMGYTPETQVYVIQNAGGIGSVNTSKFLQRHLKHFNYTSFGLTLHVARLAKFKSYCESKGFEVEIGGAGVSQPLTMTAHQYRKQGREK